LRHIFFFVIFCIVSLVCSVDSAQIYRRAASSNGPEAETPIV
jgi:hypothetical protein